MNLADGVADLHVHTTASDGMDTRADRIDQAVERDLEAIAITDHDTIGDACRRRSERRRGVDVITGVEVRADVDGTKVELLGYFVDPASPELRATLDAARKYRQRRNERMIQRLSDATGLEIAIEALEADVTGNLGRPHLAATLVDEGVVDSVSTAFERYLGTGGDAYVPMERLPSEAVIDAINVAGGVSSLAHPGRIRSDRIPEVVEQLVTAGIDGIEVWYPYGGGAPESRSGFGVEDADRLAKEHDLLRTGGSDCHGRGSGKFNIGTVRSPAETMTELRTLADQRG